MSTPVSAGASPMPATPASNGAGAAQRTPMTPAQRTPMTPQSQQAGGGGLGSARPAGGSGLGSSIPPTPQSARAFKTPNRAELGYRYNIVPNTPRTGTDDTTYEEQLNVWGTNVSIERASRLALEFFETFRLPEAMPDSQPLYLALLQEAIDKGETNINLNTSNVAAVSPDLYNWLRTYPADIIPVFDVAIAQLRERLQNPENDPTISAELADQPAISVRPFNLREKTSMRELNPEDMDTLVALKGMVIRVGPIQPDIQRAFLVCTLCNHEQEVGIEDGVIAEPQQCAHCQTRYTYRLEHNRCKFHDKQLIKIQETPDAIPEGETPHSIRVYAFEELTDFVKPGDRVEITGLYKAVATKVNPKRSALSTTYKTYIDAVHFKKTDSSRLANESNDPNEMTDAVPQSQSHPMDEGDATAEQIAARDERIRALAAEPDIYEKLTRSLAPSIWQLEDVKKGILCLLFGGANAEQGASSGKFRGEINVLMCGDPGTSKSGLLQYVHKIAPRGIYTSGKGSSAVGLTASVVKDAETKEMVLESGALVLSDRGVCCIDEFDKMSDATRSILHEVMEQQTVSIAKAGIVCTLNARTSILASANPKESRYNPKLSVVENVQIMPTLLSRFDLIYLVLDQPNETSDRKLAKHLVGLYYEEQDRQIATDVIDMELLTQYISYARRHVHPKLNPEAEDKLIEFYTGMRAQGASQKTITATPRQLEALIRLSEALAKMTLSEEVTEEHVFEAKRLMDVATQRAATDPTTGRIDMDLLQTGHSSNDREETARIGDAILNVMRKSHTASQRDRQLLDAVNADIRTHNQRAPHILFPRFKEALDDLVRDGTVTVDHHGLVKLVAQS